MLLHPLTYTRDAAPCPTFLGRTAEAVGGDADLTDLSQHHQTRIMKLADFKALV